MYQQTVLSALLTPNIQRVTEKLLPQNKQKKNPKPPKNAIQKVSQKKLR